MYGVRRRCKYKAVFSRLLWLVTDREGTLREGDEMGFIDMERGGWGICVERSGKGGRRKEDVDVDVEMRG